MARQKQKKWQVYFDLNAPRKGGPLAFSWGEAEWRIPAVYVCAQGLVVDFVRRVPAGRIQDFMDRWKLRPDSDRDDFTREEQMRIDSENLLTFDFSPALLLNGRSLYRSHGHGVGWVPLPGCHDPDCLPLLEHYGLDPAERKPPIRSLAVCMEADRVCLPGPRIKVQREGDSFPFTGLDGTAHTLTVHTYAHETLPRGTFQDEDFLYPDHCVTLDYTIEPPLPRSSFHLMDCSAPRATGPAA